MYVNDTSKDQPKSKLDATNMVNYQKQRKCTPLCRCNYYWSFVNEHITSLLMMFVNDCLSSKRFITNTNNEKTGKKHNNYK